MFLLPPSLSHPTTLTALLLRALNEELVCMVTHVFISRLWMSFCGQTQFSEVNHVDC